MTKQQIQKAIKASDKRSEKEHETRNRLGKQLAALIAKENGIAVGRSYYVLPTPGRKFRGEVVAIDRHWREKDAGKHISVLVKFYNRNGAFRNDWFSTETSTFTSVDNPST